MFSVIRFRLNSEHKSDIVRTVLFTRNMSEEMARANSYVISVAICAAAAHGVSLSLDQSIQNEWLSCTFYLVLNYTNVR